MHVVLSTVTKPGDIVMTEHVTYAGIKAITSLLHLQLRGLPTDSEGIDPQAFEDACHKGGKILTRHRRCIIRPLPPCRTAGGERSRQLSPVTE